MTDEDGLCSAELIRLPMCAKTTSHDFPDNELLARYIYAANQDE